MKTNEAILRETLVEVRHILELANKNGGPINDTIWCGNRAETLFDFIDDVIVMTGIASIEQAPDAEQSKACSEALYSAVSAIYFDDSYDFKFALLNVVRALAPQWMDEIGTDQKSVFDKAMARLSINKLSSPVAEQSRVGTAELAPSEWRTCIQCDGKGSFYGEVCDICEGIGKVAATVAPTVSGKESVAEKLFAYQEPTLYDGYTVYNALTEKARHRTSADNVADVLDAVAQILKAEKDSPTNPPFTNGKDVISDSPASDVRLDVDEWVRTSDKLPNNDGLVLYAYETEVETTHSRNVIKHPDHYPFWRLLPVAPLPEQKQEGV